MLTFLFDKELSDKIGFIILFLGFVAFIFYPAKTKNL
jgi:hypothetical protein